MYAAAFASPDLVRLLLDSGADVNARSNSGATALMWATGNRATSVYCWERPGLDMTFRVQAAKARKAEEDRRFFD